MPAAKSPAQEVAQGLAFEPVKFYVQKKAVRSMLLAIQGYRPQNAEQGTAVDGMQQRKDLSGKFSRRLGNNRRGLAKADEQVADELKELGERHKEVYPEGHADAGKPTVVYAVEQFTGKPLFKKDKAGNDTDERLTVPDSYNIADPVAFAKERTELLDEFVLVECPGFTEDDFNSFKSIAGEIVDPLLDLLRDGECRATPAERAKAIRDRITLLAKEADALDAQATEAPIALVEDAEEHDDAKGEELDAEARTAP